MCRYLRPLFIRSDEVKKELPLDTKRFEKIDEEVKATLVELWKVKKVRRWKIRQYENSESLKVPSRYCLLDISISYLRLGPGLPESENKERAPF